MYLQAQGSAGIGLGDDWNAQFSSMMFKVLQGTYTSNDIYFDNQQQANRLVSSVYLPFKDKVSLSERALFASMNGENHIFQGKQ